jgi:hypothetical protein
MASELPYRWLTMPASRAIGTRLSNADLAGMMLSAPVTAARFWSAAMSMC